MNVPATVRGKAQEKLSSISEKRTFRFKFMSNRHNLSKERSPAGSPLLLIFNPSRVFERRRIFMKLSA
jgi:hypothetical protein